MKGACVWVVCHVEILLLSKGVPFPDEMVFAVFSSRRLAERYIRVSQVDSGTWWKVWQVRLDDDRRDGSNRATIYSRRGQVLTKAPFRQGIRAALSRKTGKRLPEG
jgi:hypothetical protein